jgi:hypothetical protein
MQRAVTFIRVPSWSAERTAAYEKWYDGVHIPFRMSKPGFLGAQRYDMVQGRQRYFVLYELADPSAVVSPEYLALRRWEGQQPADSFEAPATSRPGFERGIYDQLAGPRWPARELTAPVLHLDGFSPEPDANDRFRTWLLSSHSRALSAVRGVVAVRLFALTTSEMDTQTQLHTPHPRFLTACYLESPSVHDSSEFVATQVRARTTEAAPDREPYVVVGRLVHTAYGDAVNDPHDDRRSARR